MARNRLSETRNRRYWPVAMADEIDLAALREERDQLWAEAAMAERLVPLDEAITLPKEL